MSKQKSVTELNYELRNLGPTLWEQKINNGNVTVCEIGSITIPGSNVVKQIHYINPNYNK